ncbi:hypothetical protein STENM327S_05528 [Streptomyces tendae]
MIIWRTCGIRMSSEFPVPVVSMWCGGRGQPVVRGVVRPLGGPCRAEVVALGGVVVAHVEDLFDPGVVERPDGRLELQQLLSAVA